MKDSELTTIIELKPINHPIVNYYVKEVIEDEYCPDMDYDNCEYEASKDIA